MKERSYKVIYLDDNDDDNDDDNEGTEEEEDEEAVRLPVPPNCGIHTKSLLSLPPEASI